MEGVKKEISTTIGTLIIFFFAAFAVFIIFLQREGVFQQLQGEYQGNSQTEKQDERKEDILQ